MKRFLLAALAALLLFTLCACGDKAPKNTVFTPEDVSGRELGAVRGSAAARYAALYGNARLYDSADAMLGDLRGGALDCALTDLASAPKTARRARGVKPLSEPLLSLDFSFVCAKEDRDLTRAIDAALARLRAEGTLQALTDKYILGASFQYVPPEGAGQTAGTLTFAVSADFPPYQYEDADGAPAGLDVEVARAVCDLLGVAVEFSVVESDRLVTTVQFGKADFAAGGLYQNDADLELVDFTVPYTTCAQAILVRR
jgi:polar amino acid transport system substrate-binding protein